MGRLRKNLNILISRGKILYTEILQIKIDFTLFFGENSLISNSKKMYIRTYVRYLLNYSFHYLNKHKFRIVVQYNLKLQIFPRERNSQLKNQFKNKEFYFKFNTD